VVGVEKFLMTGRKISEVRGKEGNEYKGGKIGENYHCWFVTSYKFSMSMGLWQLW